MRNTLRCMVTLSLMVHVAMAEDVNAGKPQPKFKGPLKVFVLAGQSNMEGHAEVSTFDYIGKDPLTAPLLKEMRNDDGTPRVCDKVWMSYLTGPYDGSANGEGLGKLTAGFGARDDQPTTAGSKIGPEFTFGITMEKELKQPILIIKTAWGGRSLNTEFRPPSAGPYKLPKAIQDEWDQNPQGAHGVPKLEERKEWQDEKDAASGVFYRMMVEHVKKVLADPKRVCPAYDPKQGYELAGFVWLQGFNDLVDGTTYPNENYDEYARLLAHFIRDVRKDLSAPKMPFVIGVLGVDGEKNVNFRKAMAAPAAMPEFIGNVVAVDTAPFWDTVIEAAEPKQGEYNAIVGTAHTLKQDGTLDTERKWDHYWKPVGKPLPEERIWRYATVDATEKKDKMEQYDGRRFRDITLPAGMEKWHTPDFDDSTWTSGKAPIGKGVWNHSGIKLDKFPSKWGRGEFLLMRTTFEVKNLDCASYRIAVLARQGFRVYLNGHEIHAYGWWQDKPQYGSIVLEEEQIKHLKKGKNVMAVYANDQYSPDSPEHYAALDVRIEGITKADQMKLDLALEEVLSPKDREALKGASNGGYHYFGSAKIFAQMGKAFAEALLALRGGEKIPMPDAEKAKGITVTSIKALQETIAKAEPGTTILLKNGKYNEQCVLRGKGSKERPIVVRAETIGGVELLNQVTIMGEYIVVMGFNFTDKGFVSISGNGCRFSRCHMTNVQNGQWVIVSDSSREVEIDHCLFEKKENNTILPKGCQLLRIGVLNKGEQHHVHHNHFRDIPKGKTGNGFETVQLITHGNPFDPKKSDCKTVIEDNLFERCNGEAEIISVKANGNVIRRNTFRACAGSLVLRHGGANVAAGNFFFGDGEQGSGGVRLQGVDQVVVNNYFQDLGQAAVAMMDGTPDNLYVRVERATVAHNTVVNCGYAMEIGLNHSKHPNGTVPKDCVIAGNVFVRQGDGEHKAIRFVQDDQPEDWVWVDNVVKGELGIPPCQGIVTGDPQLTIADKTVALPTKDTSTSKYMLNDVNALTGDLFGNPRKDVRTIGCVQFPVDLQGTGPLTEKRVGPDAADPLSIHAAGR